MCITIDSWTGVKEFNMHFLKTYLLAFAAWISLHAHAQTVFVSPSGNDAHNGTREKPVASFARAQELVRRLPDSSAAVVLFAPGTYYLPQTIQFTEADNKAKVEYRAAAPGKVIISGGSLLKAAWKPYKNGIYVTKLEGRPVIDQLYVNGTRQRMARFPNAVPGKNVFDAWELEHAPRFNPQEAPLAPDRVAQWKNPKGAYIHAMHEALWGDMHWQVTGKKTDSTLAYEGGWQNNRPSPMHPVYRMVEHVFEELDAPGEWYYDEQARNLYFMPPAGMDIHAASIEIVRLQELIRFSGSKANPVQHIQLHGFVFRHVARTFMENKEPLLRSDWTISRKGAVVFDGAEDCGIRDAEFDQVGGNAIVVNNYNRRISVTGCYIHHSGASGVVFVGDPASVRSPLFRYGPQDFAKMDRTPGPKNDNYPSDCLVEDCLITLTGRDEKQTAAVHISMSHKIRVNHCTVYDVPRAGINVNEGTFGGHIIENCDVFNTVLETGDHGSFNSWGRDRFWTPDIRETAAEVYKAPRLPYLDMLEPNTIRNSRWRCDHGWDIDLDDGSSWYRIYNNLLLNGGLKLREGYDRVVTNNLIVRNSLHPHVWYPNSGDVFKHNMVYDAYRPIWMDRGIAPNGKWGREMDYNFFISDSAAAKKFLRYGCDSNARYGDPKFMDPSKGDFRVKDGSPALRLGFSNFAMDNFGVRTPRLKALAKTPEIPSFFIKSLSAVKVDTAAWLGALLSEPTGEALSAFGAGFGQGGVWVLKANADAPLLKWGFKAGDLIQQINDTKIRNLADLIRYTQNHTDKSVHSFRLLRNQQPVSIEVNGILPVAAMQ